MLMGRLRAMKSGSNDAQLTDIEMQQQRHHKTTVAASRAANETCNCPSPASLKVTLTNSSEPVVIKSALVDWSRPLAALRYSPKNDTQRPEIEAGVGRNLQQAENSTIGRQRRTTEDGQGEIRRDPLTGSQRNNPDEQRDNGSHQSKLESPVDDDDDDDQSKQDASAADQGDDAVRRVPPIKPLESAPVTDAAVRRQYRKKRPQEQVIDPMLK